MCRTRSVRSTEQRRRAAEKNEARRLLDSLTPREFEVMQLVITGMLNKQVGGELGMAEKTVKIHRGRVMQKLGVRRWRSWFDSYKRPASSQFERRPRRRPISRRSAPPSPAGPLCDEGPIGRIGIPIGFKLYENSGRFHVGNIDREQIWRN